MPEKIMVVDDDLDLLVVLQLILVRSGYVVYVLSAGEKVVDTLALFQPDLIILDINLGELDGREICHFIKSQTAYGHVPIILYSAEQFPDMRIAECHADAFIHKPFVTSFMLEKVNVLLHPGDDKPMLKAG